ncbi:PTS sugar transporter subunit IIA [Clostridium boliviensis]|uniref:PTS sugar transporter subunit IIA n=1 Tax=Clostridium boliviensis TaxID=318465 RepID=A0ABU4GJD0_9CLOT|nr:PTS sugar transporter subunit IIA [Clostridium boliviensis]MDW2797719.1 PTS sugar transporter subunit IIA [Clostridium boliviensis]
MLWKELDRELIFLDLDVQCSDQVMDILGGTLVKAGYCKPDYVKALKKREKEFPTGIDTGLLGIAIPHTAVDYVNKGKIAIARLVNKVPFHQMGNDEEVVNVKLVFMLAVDNPERHLTKLQSIVEVIQDESILMRLLNAKTEEQMIDAIKEKEMSECIRR